MIYFQVPIAAANHTAIQQMKYLEDDGWIDFNTRAVFIELSVYNPPTGFICAVKILTEFLPTGTTFTAIHSHAFNFLRYSKQPEVQSLILEIIYALILTFLSFSMLYKFIKSKLSHAVPFWRGFWTILEFSTIVFGWVSVYVYILRGISTTRAITEYTAAPYYYTDFHEAANLDIMFGYCLGTLVFTVTIKIIDLLIVQIRIKIFSIIIQSSVKEMATFAWLFFIILALFAQVFSLVYGRHKFIFSTPMGSFGASFSFMMGEISWIDLMKVNGHLTPIFGIALVLVSITFLMNMFAIIICDNVALFREDPPEVRSLGIFTFMISKIRWVVFTFLPFVNDIYIKIFEGENKPTELIVEGEYKPTELIVEMEGEKMKPTEPGLKNKKPRCHKKKKVQVVEKRELMKRTAVTQRTLETLYDKLRLVEQRLDYMITTSN